VLHADHMSRCSVKCSSSARECLRFEPVVSVGKQTLSVQCQAVWPTINNALRGTVQDAMSEKRECMHRSLVNATEDMYNAVPDECEDAKSE
jgi:hypothetical protein